MYSPLLYVKSKVIQVVSIHVSPAKPLLLVGFNIKDPFNFSDDIFGRIQIWCILRTDASTDAKIEDISTDN